jgi:hypothetical protein
VAVFLLAYKSGALASLGVPAPAAAPPVVATATNPAPGGLQPNVSLTAPQLIQPVNQEYASNAAGSAVSIGAATLASPTILKALSVGANVVPIVGQVVSALAAITAALLSAHNARIKQARDENSAMNLGVQGYDQGLATINNYFVTRQITAVEAIQLVQTVMANYWAEVNPHIQPGRNGCAGGALCPPAKAGVNPCTGSIGAACCVGCYNLVGSSEAQSTPQGMMFGGALGTIAVLQQGGGTVYYTEVYGSKYGGVQRNAYTLAWVQSSAA